MTAALQPGTLEVIRATAATPRTMLEHLPDSVFATPGAEGWSTQDVVAHLVVAGRLGALARASRVLEEDHPSFAGYDEEGELEASGLRRRPVAELLALLEEERGGMSILGRALSSEDAGRTGVHLEVGEVTIANLLHQAAFHDTLHIAQIAALISAQFEGNRGPLGSASS